MPFNRKPQKFNAAIKSVVIGSGDKTVTLGGENVLPFYAFDGEIKNGPKVGVEITDLGMEGEPESVKHTMKVQLPWARLQKKQQLWKVQISSAFVWQAETRTV